MSQVRGGVARHAVIGSVAAAVGALVGIGLMTLLFSPAVDFFGGFIEVEAADTALGALGAVLATFFFAAVALLTVVAVMPLAAMGLALGSTGFERAWLAILITLPLAVVVFLGIGQLLPDSVPWL